MLFLLAFSMIFVVSAAVGRLCLGLTAARTSRYAPLIMPAVIGVYLFLLDRPQKYIRTYVIPIWFCVIVVMTSVPWGIRKSEEIRNSKSTWVQAYKQAGNIAWADSLSSYPIHPDPVGTGLEQKLKQLQSHANSLFRK